MQKKWNFALFIIIILAIFLLSCSRKQSPQAQGYIEGRYTYMATPVSGVLKEILVSRGMRVKQGQTLFILEEQPESDAFKAASENLKQSEEARNVIAANLVFAKLTFERYKILVPKNAIQQSLLDNAQSIYYSTIAQLAQANANIASTAASLEQARWYKNQKMVRAPVDSIVFDTYFRLGEFTEANKAVLSLIAPKDIKAIFFIDEIDLGKVKLGDKVMIHCDGCEKAYTGNISFISPTAEYTPPVIFSNETNPKLIFRIEAFFSVQDAYQLHPGQPVMVRYLIHE